jgi:Tfp pilus assembly protein PilV
VPLRDEAPQMSARFRAWESLAEASMSIAVAIRQPRALSTARWAVAGVSGFAALVCIIAVIVSATSSNGSAEVDHASTKAQAAAAPPPAAQEIPSKQSPSKQSPSKQAVREDRSFATDLAASAGGSSWTKNVMGDAPGTSVDSLPAAPPVSLGTPKRASPPPRHKGLRRLPQ